MATPDRGNIIEDLSMFVSPRVGLIRSIAPVQAGIEVPDSPVIYQAVLAHFDFRNAKAIDRSAAGKGETAGEAIRGAIGEAIERYCAAHADPRRLVMAPFAELMNRALDPRACILYSERQYASDGFPYHRFDEDSNLAWIPARELPSGGEVLVPAAFVYLNYPYNGPEECLIAQTSNGLAAGPNLETAVLHGLYELIERDSFLIRWLNKLPAPRIDLSDLDGLPRSLAAHFRRFGVQVCAFNLTLDIPVPVMMGLLIDRSHGDPAATVGLGCHLNPLEALRQALMETCQVYAGEVLKANHGIDRRVKLSFEDVRDLDDHSSLFASPEALSELAFLLDGDQVQRAEDLPNRSSGRVQTDLQTCAGLLDRAGSRVMFVDVTTADIMPLGLRVVRTLATGLQPMHFGFGLERRGGSRLYQVPCTMGYSSRSRLESELNPCPHPLA
jgi:ribosomal protein S12 methylthiotransferase accessory factor